MFAATGFPGSPCPACAGPLRLWRSVPASDPVLGTARFELWRCASCGSAVTCGEAGIELHELGAYGGGQPRLYRLARPLLRRFDTQRLAMLRPLVNPPARLLDVGAGRGRFVAAACAAGYDARGIEPSARGVGGAEAIGAPVTRASLAVASVTPQSLDAVTLWHVLEHLDDPGTALHQIGRWLRPGGALLVGVPNLGSVQAVIGGERWYHLDVPRHRVHYTVAGLHALLHAQGYRILHTHHLLAEHNPFGMWQSLVNRLTRTPSYLYHLLKHNAPLRSRDLGVSAAGIPLIPVAALAELMAAAAHRGGTVAVLAQREPEIGRRVP